jgi:hypothetical protein
MRVHVDILARLHVLWGVFGLLTGGSLVTIAAGAAAAPGLSDSSASVVSTVALLALIGVLLAAAGAVALGVGRLLGRRRAGARLAALLLAGPNLLLAPFGTALGIYTCWVLLNDDARRAFGRPVRATTVA